MKSAQTRQDAASNPAREPPLVHIPRRTDPDPHPRIQHLQLLAQPLREPMQQAAGPAHDDATEQQGPDIHIHIAERALNQFGERLSRLRRYGVRGGSRQGGFDIEDGLGEPVALVAEGLIVSVWELEGAGGCGFRGFEVRPAGAVVAV